MNRRNYNENQKEHYISISKIETELIKLAAFNHSSIVCNRLYFRAGMETSSPLNDLPFRSHQRHHIIQCGITFQIFPASCLPLQPFQQEMRSTTPLGITQEIPKRLKIIFQSSLATGQWRSRWLTGSPSALHMQHQSKINIMYYMHKPSHLMGHQDIWFHNI